MNVFDYWWIWDYLAREDVENWGSVLIGLFAVMPVYILFHWIPFVLFLARPRWYVWAIPLALLVIACGLLGYGVTCEVHEYWNMYQHWYIQPSGPSL